MGPGIYENMPNDEYRAQTEWISNSELSLFLTAPRLYEYRILEGNKTPQSKAQREGTIVHTAILEPKVFLECYGSLPKGTDLRTKVGKEIKERLEHQYPQKEFLPFDDYERYTACADLAHQLYGDFLGDGKAEVSFFWIDPDTGVKCKARADMLFLEKKKVLDLKTTKDPKHFSGSITEWKYHRQAAFYLDGLSTLTGSRWTDWEWLAASHEAPFLMTIHEAKENDLELGRFEYKRALLDFKECKEKGKYPALPLRSGKAGLANWYHLKVLENSKKESEHGL